MADEFVLLEDGREIDWIDPVEAFTETFTDWIVDNGHHVYTIPRDPHFTYTIRPREDR